MIPYAVTKGGGSQAQDILCSMKTDKYGNWRSLGEETLVRLAERLSDDMDDGLIGKEALHTECVDSEVYEEAQGMIHELEASVVELQRSKELRP